MLHADIYIWKQEKAENAVEEERKKGFSYVYIFYGFKGHKNIFYPSFFLAYVVQHSNLQEKEQFLVCSQFCHVKVNDLLIDNFIIKLKCIKMTFISIWWTYSCEYNYKYNSLISKKCFMSPSIELYIVSKSIKYLLHLRNIIFTTVKIICSFTAAFTIIFTAMPLRYKTRAMYP